MNKQNEKQVEQNGTQQQTFAHQILKNKSEGFVRVDNIMKRDDVGVL